MKMGQDMNEKISLLIDTINYLDINNIIYIESINNVKLKDLNIILNKYFKLVKVNTFYENDVSLLKNQMAEKYFLELKNVINSLYIEWENDYKDKGLEENTIFLNLIQQLNKCKCAS